LADLPLVASVLASEVGKDYIDVRRENVAVSWATEYTCDNDKELMHEHLFMYHSLAHEENDTQYH
jgi:hypothetical protein